MAGTDAYQNEKGILEARAPSSPVPPNADPEAGTTSPSLDKDVAMGLVGEHAQEIDAEMEKRVLRKIDLFLIPAMVVGKNMNFSNTSSNKVLKHIHI